jgi:hypothetical protein
MRLFLASIADHDGARCIFGRRFESIVQQFGLVGAGRSRCRDLNRMSRRTDLSIE